MGTKMAPSYANIFISVFEKQMLSSYHHKPFVYFHYIDDIFMIWTEGKDSVEEFLKHCNRQNKHIQFTESKVGTTVPFLDVSVSPQNEKLHTDLYCKPTDKHQYLYYTSCHPTHKKTVCPTASLFVYAVFVQQMNYFHYAEKKWNNISSIGDTQRGALMTQ